MRYRKESPEGDYDFCSGSAWLVDSPEAVAQAVLTRLRLYAGEWFLDKREGLDLDNILGYGTQGTRDREVQQRILGTQGVLEILQYASRVDGRAFAVSCTLQTRYGVVTINNEAIR